MVQPQSVTLFDTDDTPQLIAVMTEVEALDAERDIITTGNRLRILLVTFYERRGWAALGYTSWRGWAAARLGESERSAYRELTAGLVERELLTHGSKDEIGQIPERQLRPMASLRDDPPALRETWERANEIADAHGEVRTARHVQAAVAERQQHEVDALPAELPRVAPRMAAHYTSETPEWYTPAQVITCVETLFGHIDLDPCSNAKGEDANVPARVHFTREDDGLSQSWRLAPYTDEDGDTSHAVRAYVNPPYGDEIDAWVERTVSAYTSGEITEAVLLVPGRPGSGWWRRLRAYAVCLVDGRLRFVGADTGAPFPSALFYLGSDLEGFVDSFGGIGEVRPAAL